MKAIVQYQYGSPDNVLQFREIDKPIVGDDEVLVRVRATSIHPDVWHVVTGRPYAMRLMGAGLLKPKNPVPGTDLSGVVESFGKNVTRFKSGDEVFGESHRGLQWRNGGAFAEYASVPQDALAVKPGGVTFEQAASVPTSGYIALTNLQGNADIQPGQSVLINGAGGGVGSITLQIAKSYGAIVTGVDRVEKLDMIRSLGADHVIDCTKVDFTLHDKRYDLIFDVASTLSFSNCKRVLNPEGIYILIGHDHFGDVGSHTFGALPHFFKLLACSPFDSKLPNLQFSIPAKKEIMATLRELLKTGKLTPVIDKTYPLSKVPEAMRYMQEGHAQGKIIITP